MYSNFKVLTTGLIIISFLLFQAGGGGYNGLSSIKMEQDGMASLGSMKVGHDFVY